MQKNEYRIKKLKNRIYIYITCVCNYIYIAIAIKINDQFVKGKVEVVGGMKQVIIF